LFRIAFQFIPDSLVFVKPGNSFHHPLRMAIIFVDTAISMARAWLEVGMIPF
jgi:hypothetical protein